MPRGGGRSDLGGVQLAVNTGSAPRLGGDSVARGPAGGGGQNGGAQPRPAAVRRTAWVGCGGSCGPSAVPGAGRTPASGPGGRRRLI